MALTNQEIEHHLHHLTNSALALAREYRNLGEMYHAVPLHIRKRGRWIPYAWGAYMKIAFTVSDNREMPDPIQCFDMLGQTMPKIGEALSSRNNDLANMKLFVAMNLLHEAEMFMTNLLFGINMMTSITAPRVTDAQPDEAVKEKWEAALPRLCVETHQAERHLHQNNKDRGNQQIVRAMSRVVGLEKAMKTDVCI